MKILMTTDSVGGVWTYAVELARGLEEQGVEILLISSGGPLTDSQRGEIAALPHVRFVETRFKLEWMEEPWADVTAFGDRLLKLAAEFRPDVVHLNEFSHAALDWDVPTLVVGHSCVFSWFENVRGHSPGPEWDRYRRSVSRGLAAADLVVAPTRFMLDALQRHYGPISKSKVVHNGHRPSRGDEMLPAKEPFVFGAGRWWDEAKNVAALGRIAPRLPWPVKIAGLPSPDGSPLPLPREIENLGRLNSSEMLDCYRRAAIYCLPARYEPFGLTPLEAAAQGCALVLGDTPSLREVWGDNAVFVPPDDDNAIAEALVELIADEDSRASLACRGQSHAVHYRREEMADAYVRLYRELIGGNVEASSGSIVGGVH